VIKEKYKKTLSDARLSVKKTRAVHTGDKKEDGEEQADPSTAEAQVRGTQAMRSCLLIGMTTPNFDLSIW